MGEGTKEKGEEEEEEDGEKVKEHQAQARQGGVWGCIYTGQRQACE